MRKPRSIAVRIRASDGPGTIMEISRRSGVMAFRITAWSASCNHARPCREVATIGLAIGDWHRTISSINGPGSFMGCAATAP
jgi:hypothetical protein